MIKSFHRHIDMNFLFNFLQSIFSRMLQFLWVSQGRIKNSLSIYIKTNTGNTLSVDLDPKWDIRNVKEIVAPKMGIAPENIKIIFAGKELHNSTIIEECDLGQQSVLHAVHTPNSKLNKNEFFKNSIEQSITEESDFNDSGSKPMNETLSDLPLDDSDLKDDSNTEESKGNRAHFYVYCSRLCKAVTNGKLRVKCATCSSGAVTVDRDPQCWPDVLLPQRITVHCENDFCETPVPDDEPVRYARFYFKCGNHVSLGEEDAAIPLYLIKPNSRMVPCLACTDISDTVLVFPCEAGHVTCLDCFREYCSVRLRERQFQFDPVREYYTLPCPAGCPDSFIPEIHHFHLLSQQQYDQYQRFGTEEYVLRSGGLLCPRPDCGMGLIPAPLEPNQSEEECRKIQCIGGCNYVFCRKCLQGYHVGECEELEPLDTNSKWGGYTVDPLRAEEAKWDEASKTTIKKFTKPCPKCRTPTERDGGCMHMVCTRSGCNYQWCWICQIEWTRNCMGNHWFG